MSANISNASPRKGNFKCPLKVQPRNGRLQLPKTKTLIGINMIDKNGNMRKVPIHLGPRSNLFYALFQDDDVDFDLHLEAGDFKDLKTNLEVHQQEKQFCIRKDNTRYLQALESYGESFHFVKLSGEDGQAIVAAATEKYGLSFDEAALMLSQMKFKLNFGTIIDLSKITVKTLSGRSFQVIVSPNTTVKELKQKIFELEKIPIKGQKLVLNKTSLVDDKKLGDYKITKKSTIWLVLVLNGAADSSPSLSDYDFERFESSSSSEDESKGKAGGDGERGVVCFGDPTYQIFIECEFNTDNELQVEPFVIEMRMASKYKTL